MARTKGKLSVSRIAHAGIVVETDSVRCLMDPGLFPVMSGFYVMDPPVQVNLRKVKSLRFDLVIISHHHGDHFCLDSLNQLNRDTLVVYPKENPLIESYLSRMGFQRFKGVSPWEKFTIGDLTLIPTPSKQDFPEMGMLFVSEKHSCWNAVDTNIDDAIIRRVRRTVKHVDLMFCYYQLLIEWQVYRNGLGCDFLYEQHQKQLTDVAKTAPTCYVPSSCGWKEKVELWRNDRQFQMTEPQFMEDMHKLRPKIRGIRLAPGEGVDIHRGCAVKRQGLNFVRPLKRKYAFYDWRPDLGVDPIVDPNFTGYSLRKLKKIVREYLDGQLLSVLNTGSPSPIVARWRAYRMLWRLELVYPDGSKETRLLDFGGKKARWRKSETECFPHIHTSAAASVIPDLLNAEITPHQAMRLTRRVHRQYEVTQKGVRVLEKGGSPSESDPLAEALFFGTNERAVLKRLIKLGY